MSHSHILIIDLEATCWQPRPPELKSEIIEIGCALVRDNEITFNKSWFIKPVLNPVLSDFCKSLTSISQNDVNTAPYFSETLNDFTQEIEKLTESKLSELLFVSWGNYDRNQLVIDCAQHNIPYSFGEHFNLKEDVRARYKLKRCGVPDGLKQYGLDFEGTHHRGKDDALNIARIYLAHKKC